MTPTDLRERLRGVFAFPITPFKADYSLDIDGLRQNVRTLVKSGVQIIFACGGTGEFFSLTLDEYERAVNAVVEEVNGRIPVLAGTGYGVQIACQFATTAVRAGVDGLLVLPPYLIQPEQEGLYRHYRAIAQSIEVGLILYHRDNALFTPDTVSRLAELPNIIGFKDGHGNLETFTRIRSQVGNRMAWINGMPTAEMTAPAFFAVGARAYSSAVSNFIPHITLGFYRALVEQDSMMVQELLTSVFLPLCRIRDQRKGYAISFIKAAMNTLGRPAGPVRPPLINLEPEHYQELEGVLRQLLTRWEASE